MRDNEQCVCGHTYSSHVPGLLMPCRLCTCADFEDTGESGEFDEEYAR